jgi:hypothetical protein
VLGVGLIGSGSQPSTIALLDADTLAPRGEHLLAEPPGAVLPWNDGLLYGVGATLMWWPASEEPEAVATWTGTVAGIAADPSGGAWVVLRAAEIGVAGPVWGDIAHIDASGTVDQAPTPAGYNAQYIAADAGYVVTNSEGSSEVWLGAAGEVVRVKTGVSVDEVREDPTRPGHFAVASRLGEQIVFVDEGVVVRRIDSDAWPTDLSWSADGSRVYVYEHHGARVRVFDGAGNALATWPTGASPNLSLVFGTLELSAAADRLYVTNPDDDSVTALDLDGQVLWTAPLGSPQTWQQEDDPDQLAVAEDPLTGEVFTLRTRDGRLVALSPDGVEDARIALPTDYEWPASGGGPQRPLLDSLWIDGARREGWVGPFRLDLDAWTLEESPGAAAPRVYGRWGELLVTGGSESFSLESPTGAVIQVLDSGPAGGIWSYHWESPDGPLWVGDFLGGNVAAWSPVETTPE